MTDEPLLPAVLVSEPATGWSEDLAPPEVRLRRLIKLAKRAYGLHLVRIRGPIRDELASVEDKSDDFSHGDNWRKEMEAAAQTMMDGESDRDLDPGI